MTLPELAAAMAIGAMGVGISLPALHSSLRAARLDASVRDLRSAMIRARSEALGRAGSVGILFTHGVLGDGWRFYVDGGQQGIRSTEIAAGIDTPLGDAVDLRAQHPGLRFGVLAGSPVPRIPPASGWISASQDPIAFGASDIYSASPRGETSTGTIYMTDGQGMRAIVAYGPTGRLRLWRYDARRGAWLP